ncbi:MAG: DUF4397 domain-containing protein [Rhodoferax sp.]
MSKVRRQWLAGAVALVCAAAAHAQGSGRLYDPEPPLDSGYVRLVLAFKSAPVDVLVDGKPRVGKLAPYAMSDYLVLKEGKHGIAFSQAGKSWSHELTVVRGKSVTLAYTALKGEGPSHRFEDKGNTNKLKSLLSVYNLHPHMGAVDVTAAPGATKVFNAVAYGSSSTLQVNPIAVELAIGGAGKTASTKLEMMQGQTYSVVLFDEGGKPVARVFPSATERYTGP